eukprot:CAMPEP_0194234850 /NCGR_PEP_ID=MMETSP0158-20130606/2477_1 /TAXON_ID=33649 /ORGANISM="Thalassionema nitzschioides, Strain L26-B" /LENGTH=245 /DNA_ID=CAMNT_0038968145 /DNA_START=23 /DNA_END=757 /DNA_ORIENTATION=-
MKTQLKAQSFILLALACHHVCQAFTSSSTVLRQKCSHVVASTKLHSTPPATPQELIETPSIWNPIKESLNSVPAFACTNSEGQPLQYNVGGATLAFFYTDIEAAKTELAKASEEMSGENTKLKLNPFPLGEVFAMGAQNMALLIPSSDSLTAAGAPLGMNPVGQQVPLFGCLSMVETLPDGTSDIPLFFSEKEAKEAMDMALKSVEDEKMKDQFEVTVMPLAGAIQTQAKELGKRTFTYVPEQSS